MAQPYPSRRELLADSRRRACRSPRSCARRCVSPGPDSIDTTLSHLATHLERTRLLIARAPSRNLPFGDVAWNGCCDVASHRRKSANPQKPPLPSLHIGDDARSHLEYLAEQQLAMALGDPVYLVALDHSVRPPCNARAPRVNYLPSRTLERQSLPLASPPPQGGARGWKNLHAGGKRGGERE